MKHCRKREDGRHHLQPVGVDDDEVAQGVAGRAIQMEAGAAVQIGDGSPRGRSRVGTRGGAERMGAAVRTIGKHRGAEERRGRRWVVSGDAEEAAVVCGTGRILAAAVWRGRRTSAPRRWPSGTTVRCCVFSRTTRPFRSKIPVYIRVFRGKNYGLDKKKRHFETSEFLIFTRTIKIFFAAKLWVKMSGCISDFF